MMTFLKDVLNDNEIMLTTFYGIKVEPDPNYAEKLAQSIETLGSRHLLHESIRRTQNETIKQAT